MQSVLSKFVYEGTVGLLSYSFDGFTASRDDETGTDDGEFERRGTDYENNCDLTGNTEPSEYDPSFMRQHCRWATWLQMPAVEQS